MTVKYNARRESVSSSHSYLRTCMLSFGRSQTVLASRPRTQGGPPTTATSITKIRGPPAACVQWKSFACELGVKVEKCREVRTNWSVPPISIPGHLEHTWLHFAHSIFLILFQTSKRVQRVIIPRLVAEKFIILVLDEYAEVSKLQLWRVTALTLSPTLLGLRCFVWCQGRGERAEVGAEGKCMVG